MIDPSFLDLLCCPTSRQPLRVATAAQLDAVNAAIASGRLCNRGGTRVERPLAAALATADGGWLYPIEDDIPVLLATEAVPCPPANPVAGP